jgi:hypothetical protein
MGTIFVDNLEPQSGTSLTLGASGDAINLATGATAGFGKIGQVVQTSVTDTFTTSASSLTDITGLSVSITPTSTSSKILISVNAIFGIQGGYKLMYGLKRDSTAIALGDSASSRQRVSGMGRIANDNDMRTCSIFFLDTPNTTSSTTYQVTGFAEGSQNLYLNRTYGDGDSVNIGRGISTITAMEVLA